MPKISRAISTTLGMRVEPPTRMISSGFSIFASRRQLRQGSTARRTVSSQSCSSLARVSVAVRCFGPVASIEMNGRLISVEFCEESSHLAFSAASLRRCRAIVSFDRSMPFSLRNSSTSHWITRRSKSSPPRCVSPLVALTSKTPSPISRIEMSNVPPPKS